MFENVVPTVFAGSFRSPEGPSFDHQGRLHFVDLEAGSIYRVTPKGEASLFVNTGGRPNGSKFRRDGHLFVTDAGRGEILDISPDGAIRVAASGWRGGCFRGPNDLVFAANGDLYFTDPEGSGPENPVGNVFILRRDGSVEWFAGGLRYPNGILFADDGQTLYVSETYPNRILAFELDEKGHERSRRVFAQLEGGLGPDGMAFGRDGNLYVAHFNKGVVEVVDPEGSPIAELPAGGMRPTNVAFWEDCLYVTEFEKGQVTRLEIGVEGQVLYGLS